MIDHSKHGHDPMRCVCLCGKTHEEIYRQATARVVLLGEAPVTFPIATLDRSRPRKSTDLMGLVPDVALDVMVRDYRQDPVRAATAILGRRR